MRISPHGLTKRSGPVSPGARTGRRRLGILTGATAALALATSVAHAASPVGVWATGGNKSHVQVFQCGSFLCGKIVWLKEPNGKDGKPARDRNNPDAAKRNQTIVGLQIISGLKPTSGGKEWKDGTVYDPENGKSYGVQITLSDSGKLEVRGYEGVPMLGETKTWTRVK